MSQVPPGPGNRPPLDDLEALRDGPHAFFLRVARNYGPVVRYPVGPLAVYLVTGPDGVRHILQDNHKNYSKDTFQYNLLSTITGKGLLTSDGEHWLRQRRLAQSAFQRQRIAGFAPMIVDAAGAMLDRWSAHAASGKPIDVASEMMHVALQIVGKAMFSAEIGDQADELATATLTVLDHIVGRARTFGVVPEWLPTRGNRAHQRALSVLDEAVMGTIAERRQSLRGFGPTAARQESTGPADAAGSGRDPMEDLLALLMRATDEQTGEQMSDQHLRDESMTMLIAGHETVASALAWTWHLLAENPLCEEMLHAELDRELAGRAPAAADLQEWASVLLRPCLQQRIASIRRPVEGSLVLEVHHVAGGHIGQILLRQRLLEDAPLVDCVVGKLRRATLPASVPRDPQAQGRLTLPLFFQSQPLE